MFIDLRVHHERSTTNADAAEECNTREFLEQILKEVLPQGNVEDWDLKAVPEGPALELDRTLLENLVHSRQDLYLVRRPIIEDIGFTVETPDGKVKSCRTPGDTSTAEFLAAFIGDVGLKKIDDRGRPIGYDLMHQQGSGILDRGRTLTGNGVGTGARLIIRPTSDPIPVVVNGDHHDVRPWIIAAVAVGILACIALIWKLWPTSTSPQAPKPVPTSVADNSFIGTWINATQQTQVDVKALSIVHQGGQTLMFAWWGGCGHTPCSKSGPTKVSIIQPNVSSQVVSASADFPLGGRTSIQLTMRPAKVGLEVVFAKGDVTGAGPVRKTTYVFRRVSSTFDPNIMK